MSYGVKYYIDYAVRIGSGSKVGSATIGEDVIGTAADWCLEILQKDFTGDADEEYATGGFFSFGYDQIDVKRIWENPVQKGVLSVELFVGGSAEQAILDNIIAADEKEYQLRLKKNTDVKWTGFIIPDLLQYSEGPYPFGATITAKDMHLLESEDYETNTAISYALYSTELASILNSTGLDLDLHTYNEWTANNLTSTDDYFEQTYFDKFHLQDFSSYADGGWQPLTKMQVLKEVVPPGFVLRQWNNAWKLIDLSHLAQHPTSATRYEYDDTGTRTGKTTSLDTSFTVDRKGSFVLPSSTNMPFPATKQLEMEFNHKTDIQNFLFKEEYINSNSSEQKSERLDVKDTTNRELVIFGQVEVTTDTNPGSSRTGTAQILVQVGSYELEFSGPTWATGNGVEDVNVIGSDNTLTGTFGTIRSGPIPVDVDEDSLKIEMRWATVGTETVQQVRWYNLSAKLVNGDSINNDAQKHYALSQTGSFSFSDKVGTFLIGQGPDKESNSALRYFSGGAQYLNLSGFKHVGGSAYQYERFVLQNIMNMQRSIRHNIETDLLALFEPDDTLEYRSKYYFMLNGNLNGKGSVWSGNFVELKWETGTDSFNEYSKVKKSDSVYTQ